MLCKPITDAMENKNVNVVDTDYTYCLTNQTYAWFNSSDSVSVSELERLIQLNSECPLIPGHGRCKCESERMTFVVRIEYKQKKNIYIVYFLVYFFQKKQFRINARVDCSNMGLTELPKNLPVNTIFLNVSNNNVYIGKSYASTININYIYIFYSNFKLTNLNEFNSPSYEHIIKFYADDNQVQSLLDLEGTKFLEIFHILALRRNKLKTVSLRGPNGLQLLISSN